jgi:hypothetical protein
MKLSQPRGFSSGQGVRPSVITTTTSGFGLVSTAANYGPLVNCLYESSAPRGFVSTRRCTHQKRLAALSCTRRFGNRMQHQRSICYSARMWSRSMFLRWLHLNQIGLGHSRSTTWQRLNRRWLAQSLVYGKMLVLSIRRMDQAV